MGEIMWESDLMKALEEAKSDNKLLFVSFSNPGCKACAEMDAVTFVDDRLQEYMKNNFILLKFKSSINPEKYLRFRVAETPTYIVLNLMGKEVKRMTGYRSPDKLIEELDNARSVS
jgi:thiol:disulfide interchange protein DsbD